MRQEPLESTAVLFGDVRAGRAAARSFVLGLKIRPAEAESPNDSFLWPGTDGKLSCGTGVAKRRG